MTMISMSRFLCVLCALITVNTFASPVTMYPAHTLNTPGTENQMGVISVTEVKRLASAWVSRALQSTRWDVHVKEFHNGNWHFVGQSSGLNVNSQATATTPAIYSDGNEIIVAWAETHTTTQVEHIFVKHWNGISWTLLGTPYKGANIDGTLNAYRPSVGIIDGVPVVGFTQFNQVWLRYWDGIKWNTATNAAISTHSTNIADEISLHVSKGIYANRLYMTWEENNTPAGQTQPEIHVAHWSVGNPVVQRIAKIPTVGGPYLRAKHPDIDVLIDGDKFIPYVTHVEVDAFGSQGLIYAHKYDFHNGWQHLGASHFSQNLSPLTLISLNPSIALINDIPYVKWTEYLPVAGIAMEDYLAYFNGTSWSVTNNQSGPGGAGWADVGTYTGSTPGLNHVYTLSNTTSTDIEAHVGHF